VSVGVRLGYMRVSFMYILVYVCILVYIRACVTVRVYLWVSVCFSCNIRTRSSDPNREQETQTRSGFVLVVGRYIGDSESGSCDDPEIRTDSCSRDQTVIRFQNSVISCKCLFLCVSLFTVVGIRLHVTLIISYDFLLYFTSLIT